MGKPSTTIGIALLATAVFVIHVDSRGQDLSPNKNLQSVETFYSLHASAGGIGADQQEAVSKAVGLIKQGQLASADTILDVVLSRFTGLMGDANKTYVCFRETDDYRQFLNEIQDKQTFQARRQVTRVNISFAQALQMKAYIASSRREWDRAIYYLNKKISYAPYEAQPHIEMGYILNVQGKPKEAVESYRRGYALATAHDAEKTHQAMALRGLGSAQIELGRLDDAVDSFKKSLEIEPRNKTALNELRYIEQMRANGR
jgi:tetratricopeptide (TPR) repeat protein